MRRVTAREFQKRFQRLEEPVLINDGIFFPRATAELLAIAESPQLSEEEKAVVGDPVKDYDHAHPITVPEAPRLIDIIVPKAKKVDLSKAAQAKGKMGR